MKITEYQLTVVTLTELLGTQSTKDVATGHIAKRSGFKLPEDEAECLPDALERKTTVFHRDRDGQPQLLAYQFKGFLKAAAEALNGKPRDDEHNMPKALHSKVEKHVFVSPRFIPLYPPGHDWTKPGTNGNGPGCLDLIDYCERPLRAMTALGPRVTVARSEQLPAGVTFRCGLTVFPGEITEEALRELLDYGFYCGLLQWRNGGFGSFRYELEAE